MRFNRHDLVFARWDDAALRGLGAGPFHEFISSGVIPGIVRREESAQRGTDPWYDASEEVYVGFVYPYKEDGHRLRYASSVRGSDITRVLRPYEVPHLRYERRTRPLRVLSEFSASYPVGVWGSASLEVVTGLDYTDDTSDLDLIVRGYGPEELLELARTTRAFEDAYDIRIDVEIELSTGYAINLKEYAADEEMVLAKGITGVELLERTMAEEQL
jgi:phosphoribosyl-dephospho-CoA transferase